jgi:UPF0716 family protein affecting phage T7 exclusion
MVKWIIIAILLLPLAEIVAFIVVAAWAGLAWAMLLMLATTLAGFLVLRHAGRGGIARFRVAVADTDVAGIEANAGGFLTVLAGLLLFLPGFLTDLIGAALLIGPVRRWCGKTFRLWVQHHNPGDRSVVDLAPEEWEQVPDRKLSNRSNKSGRD